MPGIEFSKLFKPANPVKITYTTNHHNAPIVEHFDFLVVACDPRILTPIFKSHSDTEKEVFNALSSFTFLTSEYRANRPYNYDPEAGESTLPRYTVKFNMNNVFDKNGTIYGFRDEVMARTRNPSENGVTYLNAYQLLPTGLIGRDPAAVRASLNSKRDQEIAHHQSNWIDWKQDLSQGSQPVTTLLADYFPHYTNEDLEDEKPWKMNDIQGKNHTIYVSSFLCFESVLHVYLYMNMLMNDDVGVVRDEFPKDKKARIAVIGAGVSGILFASQHLKKKGYENFKVFEATERHGGKTKTVMERLPTDPTKTIPCESGTCYLSYSYEPMWHLFTEYDAGRVVGLNYDGAKYRSIIDPEWAQTEDERVNGIEFEEWTRRRNGPWSPMDVVVAGVKYLTLHWCIMGMTMNDPMPKRRPSVVQILNNVKELIGALVKAIPDAIESVRAKDLYLFLRDNIGNEGEGSEFANELFSKREDIEDCLQDCEDSFSFKDILDSISNLFELTYDQFLDRNGLQALKNSLVYAYQIQGYGTLESIPAYYGLIWVTPSMLLGDIRHRFFPRADDPDELASVNVASEGWLKLWDNMVERDLKDKIVYNARISTIDRVIS